MSIRKGQTGNGHDNLRQDGPERQGYDHPDQRRQVHMACISGCHNDANRFEIHRIQGSQYLTICQQERSDSGFFHQHILPDRTG